MNTPVRSWQWDLYTAALIQARKASVGVVCLAHSCKTPRSYIASQGAKEGAAKEHRL